MDIVILHDKDSIYNFLKENLGHQLYSIGDLDDFFWPKTVWYGLTEAGRVKSIALLYVGMSTPTLLSFHNEETYFSHQLIEGIKPFLPPKFNAHLSDGLSELFGKQKIIEYYGLHYKMVLTKTVYEPHDSNIRILTGNDLSEMKELYQLSYPENWFDGRMVETKKYYGYFINGSLVGISGIHVFSETYRVAALGNITTHPGFRDQNIAYKLTSALCFDLQKSVDIIGLNVRTDNDYAIRCYKKAGFEIIGSFEECLIQT